MKTEPDRPEIKPLTLLLIFLSSWEEDSRKNAGEKVLWAYKEYLYVILDELEEEGLIRQLHKKVTLTEEGKLKAMELEQMYLKNP